MSKWLVWLLVLVGASVFSVVVLVGVLTFWPDAPPPNDAWMLPVFRENPSQRDPLAEFQKWLSFSPLPDSEPEWKRVASNDTWNIADAQVIQKKYHEAVERFDVFADTDPVTWSWWWNPQGATFEPSENVSKFSTIAILARSSARLNVEQKHPIEAAREAERLVKVGRGLQGAEGGMLLYMTGCNYIARGVLCFRWIAQKGDGSDEDWKNRQIFLSQMEPEAGTLTEAFKMDYLRFKQTIDHITHRGSGEPEMMTRGRRVFMKPNATFALYQEVLGPLIKTLPQQDWSTTDRELTKMENQIAGMKSNKVTFFASSNPAGKFLAVGLPPNYRGVLHSAYATHALMRCAVCAIALHRCERDTGKVPDKLTDLSPLYLPEVPLDPFDKKPIRWNPGKSKIYSVGPDMKDDGGETNEAQLTKGKDIGQTYWWRGANGR